MPQILGSLKRHLRIQEPNAHPPKCLQEMWKVGNKETSDHNSFLVADVWKTLKVLGITVTCTCGAVAPDGFSSLQTKSSLVVVLPLPQNFQPLFSGASKEGLQLYHPPPPHCWSPIRSKFYLLEYHCLLLLPACCPLPVWLWSYLHHHHYLLGGMLVHDQEHPPAACHWLCDYITLPSPHCHFVGLWQDLQKWRKKKRVH